MTFTRFCAAFAAFATTALLFAAPASAQATRTWVSGVGDDANPCSRTAPCKTFAGAISKTAPAGEIDCLDPGGFGAVTITKSITIYCDEISNGGVLVSGTNGIVVSVASTDKVQLVGLDIDGLNTGLAGVLMNGPGSLAVIDCLIYEFTTAGVSVTGNGARVYVENSIIRNNFVGVQVTPASGFATAELDRSALDANATNLQIGNASGTAILTGNTLTGGASISNTGGTVISFGNNAIRPSAAGAITTTTPLQ